MTHRGVDVEHALGRIGIPVVHRAGVVRQALREVPLGAVGILDPLPENIAAKRSIGVRAPAPFHPWIGPRRRDLAEVAWAASKLAGDVNAFSA